MTDDDLSVIFTFDGNIVTGGGFFIRYLYCCGSLRHLKTVISGAFIELQSRFVDLCDLDAVDFVTFLRLYIYINDIVFICRSDLISVFRDQFDRSVS